jgi:hypothetical protein
MLSMTNTRICASSVAEAGTRFHAVYRWIVLNDGPRVPNSETEGSASIVAMKNPATWRG